MWSRKAQREQNKSRKSMLLQTCESSESSARMHKSNVNRTQISRFHMRLAWGRNRFRNNSIPREENSQDGGHCLGRKTVRAFWMRDVRGIRAGLAKFGGSGKFDDRGLESAIRPQIRLGLSSAIRFLRERSDGRVNFNDSDLMLESTSRSFPFLVLDYR